MTILPLVLIGLSLSGLWSTFGGNAFAIAAWVAAVLAALLLNRVAKWPRKVSYAPETRSFLVEGSWAPLAVMMIIFFARYTVAVTLAMQPELAATLWLPVAVSFAYGLMSGAFLARAVRILGAKSMSAELTIPGAIHLVAVVPAVVIGVVQLASKKGTPRHRRLGWIWVASMIVVALFVVLDHAAAQGRRLLGDPPARPGCWICPACAICSSGAQRARAQGLHGRRDAGRGRRRHRRADAGPLPRRCYFLDFLRQGRS